MFQNLQYTLNFINSNNKKQQHLLNSLFLEIHELYITQQNINMSFKPRYDLFYKIRIEVIGQIFQFLDIKSILTFRLIKRDYNIIILNVIPFLLECYRKKCQELDIQKNQILQSLLSNEIQMKEIHLKQQLANNYIDSINLENILEFKRIKKPSKIVLSIVHLLVVLLYPNFDQQNDTLETGKHLLSNSNFLNQLFDFDISKISEQQLDELQLIHRIRSKQLEKESQAFYLLYDIIKILAELRETQFYIDKNKIYNLQVEQQNLKQMIINIEKIPIEI